MQVNRILPVITGASVSTCVAEGILRRWRMLSLPAPTLVIVVLKNPETPYSANFCAQVQAHIANTKTTTDPDFRVILSEAVATDGLGRTIREAVDELAPTTREVEEHLREVVATGVISCMREDYGPVWTLPKPILVAVPRLDDPYGCVDNQFITELQRQLDLERANTRVVLV